MTHTFVQKAACAFLIMAGSIGVAQAQTLQATGELTDVLIDEMRAAHTGEFATRTQHFGPDGETPRFLNRLVLEDSPYLRQHSHNPVDWRPWTPETLEFAKEQNKPIFLSIGYATCHWCHVMEHESFDNTEIADVLNERFVPIKVDREQNPDVDLLYMTAMQLFGDGGGGWPLTGFLMPNSKPFFMATYLRPNDLKGVMGQVNNVWDQKSVRSGAVQREPWQLGSPVHAGPAGSRGCWRARNRARGDLPASHAGRAGRRLWIRAEIPPRARIDLAAGHAGLPPGRQH